MSFPPRMGLRRSITAALVVATGLTVPATASAVSRLAREPQRATDAAKPYFDSRASARRAAPKLAASGRTASQRSAVRALRDRLGAQGAIAIDPLTGTARSVQRLDGTLTGPASGDKAAVAMRWVRANRTALGLSA